MVKPFSRNTKLENHCDEPLKVIVRVDGGRYLSDDMIILIPPGEHSYICYDDLGIEYNRDRPKEVIFIIGNQETESILTSDIRDHPKIIFSIREDGTIAHELVKGSMIEMNGYLDERCGGKGKVIDGVELFRIPIGVITMTEQVSACTSFMGRVLHGKSYGLLCH